MKTKKLFFMNITALICVAVFTSCNSETSETEIGDEVFYKATVLGIGGDCKICLIVFDEEVPNLPASPCEIPCKNTYYAHNLPENYQIAEKRIEVKLGFPKEPLAIACTTMGLAYGHIYIAEVR